MAIKTTYCAMWLAPLAFLVTAGLARAYTPAECEELIPLTIMVGYNFETHCTVAPEAGVYTFEITLIKPYFLDSDEFGTFVGACVGCVGQITSESSWKTDYLYMNANGKRWRIKTSACREAMKKTSGEAIAVGAYIINRLELVK